MSGRHGVHRKNASNRQRNDKTWPKKSLPFTSPGFDVSIEKAKRMCTDKRMYPSKAEVKKAAKQHGLNWYHCKFCGFYHLTKRDVGKFVGRRSSNG